MGKLLTKLRTTRGVRADFSNDVFPGTVHGSLGQARSPVQVELASGRLNNASIMAQTVSKRKNYRTIGEIVTRLGKDGSSS